MDDQEIKEHFKKAGIVVAKGISESKQNFDRLTNIIHKLYSDINKGELIVASGAFSIVVTFLIQKSNINDYNGVNYLKAAVCLLFFVIVWKFHLNRNAVLRAEKERLLIDTYLVLLNDIQLANTEYLVKNNPDSLLKTPETFEKIDSIEKDRKSLNSPESRFRNNLSNEIEYYAFFSGTALLLIFFLFNL